MSNTLKPEDSAAQPKYKHAFVGTDSDGDSCIYVVGIEEDGSSGEYLSHEILQKIADRINRMRIGLSA